MCRSVLAIFVTFTLYMKGCHTCPEQLPSTVGSRINGRCQSFPSRQLFCSQYFNESSMVYIHDNINYTFLNEQLLEWKNDGHFGNTILDALERPSSFCSSQIPYMVCVYLYPLCDGGIPLALCQDECSALRLQCCDAVNNLTSLIANMNDTSPLQLLCDYDNVDVAGNLNPHPAGDPSCHGVKRAPHIITNTILNITGVDHTVVTGIRTNPCQYQFNRSYAFVCNVSGLPTPQVTWYYQRILLGEITVVTANSTNGYVQYNVDSTTSVLVISNMTRSNAGIYYCNATNDVGFDLLAIEAIVTNCYDSSGACHPLIKKFTQNCSQCVYSDNDCIIECDPLLCPSVSNNCDKQVPTTDGCCITCAPSEDTADAEDSGLSTGATAAITVLAVLAILILTAILFFLCFKQTIKPKKGNKLNIQRLNMTINRSHEEAPLSTYNVLVKAKEENKLPVKYSKLFSDLSDAEIPLELLSIGTEIGEGAFGTVYRGSVTVNQTDEVIDVAMRTINEDVLDSDEVESFLNECILMKKVDHVNVLGLLGVCFDNENGLPYVILPFMSNGDLKTFLYSERTTSGSVLTNSEGLDHATLLRMCCEIACGMECLARHKLVHRDLAARNCLVASDLTIKVGDSGLSRQLYSKDYYKLKHCTKVPIKWMPLESIHDEVFNEKTDVWAFGVTCWEVFTMGATPYSALEFEDLLPFLEKGSRLSKPQLCSQNVYNILLQCWELSPDNRPLFSVLACEFTESLLPSEYVNIRNSGEYR